MKSPKNVMLTVLLSTLHVALTGVRYLKDCSFNGWVNQFEKKHMNKNISSEQLPGLSNTLIKK